MRYTLRQLEVFLAVAAAESGLRAAGELAMSQSAVSGALSDLERQFDVRLFDRVGKRLQLNELGRAVRPRAQAVLEQAAALERVLSNKEEIGRIRVGATMTIGNHLAVPLIASFMRENPGARITLDVANTEEIARRVENFEIDVGLIEGEYEHPDLEASPWRRDELVVFTAPGHPWAKKRSLSDDDLRRVPWVVRERGSGTRQAFERAMSGILPELHIALELQHTEAIKGAVRAGLGAGCVSKIALEEDFRLGSLEPRSVPHRDFHRHFYFLLHRQKYRTAGIERWLELCRRQPRGRTER
jgi:DNA-binding transcriptional LysR family regulator